MAVKVQLEVLILHQSCPIRSPFIYKAESGKSRMQIQKEKLLPIGIWTRKSKIC